MTYTSQAIQKAIQKAIETGYNPDWNTDEKHLLDPLFWQALGKALGWGDYAPYGLESESPAGYDDARLNSWRWHWHRFIDHLASGKDVDEFFKELLK